MRFHLVVLGAGASLLLLTACYGGDVGDAFDKTKDALDKVKAPTLFAKVVGYGTAAVEGAVAVKLIVDLIKTFTSGAAESAELKYMKKQFAIVNSKLDALEYDFAEVKNMIDWNVVKVNVGRYERKIKSLAEKVKVYFEAPSAAREVYGMMFVQAYEFEYSDSATKLYFGMSNENNIFSDNLFRVSATYFKYHRGRAATFIGYVMQTIQKGLMVEAAYHNLTDDTDSSAERQKEWLGRFKKLEGLAKKADAEIEGKWTTQYRLDVDEFVVRNPSLGNADMANKVNAMLTEKYPWRKWFVVVHGFTDNNPKDRYYTNCQEGFIKSNVGGKVIIVNSFPSSQKNPRYKPRSLLTSYWSRPIKFFDINDKIAQKLFEKSKFNCNHYLFFGFIEKKSNPVFSGEKQFFDTVFISANRPFHSAKSYTGFVIS